MFSNDINADEDIALTTSAKPNVYVCLAFLKGVSLNEKSCHAHPLTKNSSM